MKKNKLFLTAGLAAVMAIGIFIYALNNSKYEVKFNSNGGNKIESVMVKKNERVEAPKDPKKKGYVFVEWQLNGKSYDFKKKVTKNMTLKAKWLPEIYVTVTLDSNGGSELQPMSVISGTKLSKDEIEKPTREGYTFAGWLIGENKYDFSKKVTSDLTLKASWVEGENVVLSEEEVKEDSKKEETKTEVKEDSKKEETKTEVKKDSKKEETKTEVKEDSKKEETKTEVKEDSKKEETKTEEKKDSKKEETKTEEKKDSKKSSKKESDKSTSKDSTKNTSTSKEETKTATITFKKGDKITITGEYANSCDGDTTGYKAAIGWDAEVIAVYESQEYPYQVANSRGTIGFFKAESLKIKN